MLLLKAYCAEDAVYKQNAARPENFFCKRSASFVGNFNRVKRIHKFNFGIGKDTAVHTD